MGRRSTRYENIPIEARAGVDTDKARSIWGKWQSRSSRSSSGVSGCLQRRDGMRDESRKSLSYLGEFVLETVNDTRR
jgi:hypothetical protein